MERIVLVKGHGLVMVQSLQTRAEETFTSMKTCLEEHYLAEMKRYGTVYLWVHVLYVVVLVLGGYRSQM